MPPLNRALFLAPLLFVVPASANAQNFFEELFGIGRAAKPPVPPRGVPGGGAGGVQPGTPVAPPAGAPGDVPATEVPRAPPVPKQPVVLKAPMEDNVMGQELLRNGLDGNLKLEKAGGAVTARVTLPGTKISAPNESCTVPWNGGTPAPLTAEGRPEGLPRFEAAGATCPLRFEIVEGGVFVTSLSGAPVCTVTASDCSAAPTGLWGPTAATLIPRSAEFDTARGTGDRAVRENYKLMTQRARGQDVRPIVTEQAAFSSDREQMCRTYAREGAHGFCNLRFTEGRALALATRLGINTANAAPTTTAAPRPRRKPQPAIDGMNPDAGGATSLPD